MQRLGQDFDLDTNMKFDIKKVNNFNLKTPVQNV